MARQSEVAEVLIGCRVADPDRWAAAVRAVGRDLGRILDELAAAPPPWWDGKGSAPPGLTDYQRWAIESRVAENEVDALRRDLALNQFVLLDRLGRGGQGEVYRGRQLNPPRYVAIKTLVQDTEPRRRRFEQEARTMMKIRHPAVARFYLYERVRDTAGKPTDEYLIAMELVDGTDLYRVVQQSGPVRWRFAAHWAAGVLGGLAEIHRHGFVHRDVKPENVMAVGPLPGPGVRVEDTAAKLLDFGAVRPAAGDAPGGRVFIGTREYAPAEQWGGEVVPASDLYALGGTLFYLLTGRPPFEIPDRDPFAFIDAHTNKPAPDLQELNPDVPDGLDRLYRRMMEKDPAERGTAAQLAAEFDRLLGRAPVEPNKPPPTSGRDIAQPIRSVRVENEEQMVGLYYRLIDPPLALLERVLLRGYLRPPPGREPPFGERILALLRRPAVILILLLVTAGLIFLLLR